MRVAEHYTVAPLLLTLSNKTIHMPPTVSNIQRPELQLYLAIDQTGLRTIQVSTNSATGDELVPLQLDRVNELRFSGAPLLVDIRARLEGSEGCNCSLRLKGQDIPVATSSNGNDLVLPRVQVSSTRVAFDLYIEHPAGHRHIEIGLATNDVPTAQAVIEPWYKPPRGTPPPCVGSDDVSLATG